MTPRFRLVARAAALSCAVVGMAAGTQAADHREAPAVSADPAADINDVFAWMSPDAARVYLVMTVFPGATSASAFSDGVQYVFHAQSGPAYGALAATETRIVCTFDPDQQVACLVDGGPSVRGDASDAAGIASADGAVRVFAGPRNDPFFFNSAGFNAVAGTVRDVASGLDFDDAGCPLLDADTVGALGGLLVSDGAGGPGMDGFAFGDVLTLALSVDKSLLARDGDVLAVWGSTHRRP